MFLHLKIINCCWFTEYWLLTKICCWFVVISLDLGFETGVRGWDFTGTLLLHDSGLPTGKCLHDRMSSDLMWMKTKLGSDLRTDSDENGCESKLRVNRSWEWIGWDRSWLSDEIGAGFVGLGLSDGDERVWSDYRTKSELRTDAGEGEADAQSSGFVWSAGDLRVDFWTEAIASDLIYRQINGECNLLTSRQIWRSRLGCGIDFTAGCCSKKIDQWEIWRSRLGYGVDFTAGGCSRKIDRGEIWSSRLGCGVDEDLLLCELHGRVFPAATTAASTVNLEFWLWYHDEYYGNLLDLIDLLCKIKNTMVHIHLIG